MISVLLAYDSAPLGSQFPEFQDNVVVPSSGVKMSKKTEFCELAPCWGHTKKINITVTVVRMKVAFVSMDMWALRMIGIGP